MLHYSKKMKHSSHASERIEYLFSDSTCCTCDNFIEICISNQFLNLFNVLKSYILDSVYFQTNVIDCTFKQENERSIPFEVMEENVELVSQSI